ncbi:TPA: carboxymuconolactone decarboxylase family protein, partial [Klebsiella oxytoca]|nr:carboxymuconolactone decarboxylase family protein [Klebsiella oxytoca]
LAQITQYARQLASSPSLINALSRSQLDEVGLTSRDIILINQIIGFIGFQARAIAAFHAALGYPVRWIPGMPQQEDAPEALFFARESDWRPGLDDSDLRYADDERQSLLAKWQKYPGLFELAPLLATQEPPLDLQELLLSHLSDQPPFAAQVALIAARINGSISCFNAWASRCQDFADALRGIVPDAQSRREEHVIEHRLLQSIQLLTRSPDRFSAAHLSPLTECGLSRTAAIDLLAWCGLCGWMNRLKIALGNGCQQT